jgi:hypothetical protein
MLWRSGSDRGSWKFTAIHNHLAAVFYVHFWANNDAAKLAKGLRAALEKTAIAQNPY